MGEQIAFHNMRERKKEKRINYKEKATFSGIVSVSLHCIVNSVLSCSVEYVTLVVILS